MRRTVYAIPTMLAVAASTPFLSGRARAQAAKVTFPGPQGLVSAFWRSAVEPIWKL